MKILNLYAGIGGNRKLWEDVEVTAVEIDPKIAGIYQDFFPQDKVIVDDAHQYLLSHVDEYDFIWSSPPCQTHSRMRTQTLVPRGQKKPEYPDMRLYQEILFLQGYFKGRYCVENVKGWYEPLIKPQTISRHYFWSNFFITPFRMKGAHVLNKIGQLEERVGFDLSKYSGFDRTKTLRKEVVLHNCVYPPLGKHILDCARGMTVAPLSHFTNIRDKDDEL